MKIYSFPDKWYWKVFLSLGMTALIMLSRDGMYGMLTGGFYVNTFLTYAILGAIGAAFLWVNRRELRAIFLDRRILLAIVCAVIFLIPMAVKADWQMMYISVLICLMAGILVSYFVSLETLSRYYTGIAAVLGIWSVLAAYVFRLLPDLGMAEPIIRTNDAGNDFYFMWLSFVPVDYVSYRNFGFFREPGVYQFFLILGLYVNNYQANWKKGWQLWAINLALVLTLITTFATGGLIELALLAVVIFLDKEYYRHPLMRLLAAAAIVAVASAVAYSLITQSLFYGVLNEIYTKLFTAHESTVDRLGSISSNLGAFSRSPLVGEKLSDVITAVNNNTSTSTLLMGYLGIGGLLVQAAGWIALVWQGKKHLFWQSCLLVILAMSFNTCNISWNIYFWLFPMVALCQKGLPLLSRKRK